MYPIPRRAHRITDFLLPASPTERFKMAPATRLCLLPLRQGAAVSRGTRVTRVTAAAAAARAIHTNPAQPAKVAPVYGTGPPPEPPLPSAEFANEIREERLARRRRQAEMLKQAGDIKAMREEQREDQRQEDKTAKPTMVKRRFWKNVDVKEVNGMSHTPHSIPANAHPLTYHHLPGAFEIHLDARPLRHPTTKTIIRLPLTKPNLAHAIAVEWDALTSAQQATKHHLIPLTSLACRALDIAASPSTTRPLITQTLLRYLDTDSLLCVSPPPSPLDHDEATQGPHLRTLQDGAYAETVGFLTTHVWPGITIVPVLEGDSLMPRSQAPGTREVVQGWIETLTGYELAGLERATLAGKSLLAAARLVVEWSEEGAGLAAAAATSSAAAVGKGTKKFGVEEAARAVSLEVEWQTKKWGEVEDTHDVEKEDLRRQLGSAVLLVLGNGAGEKSS